MADEEESCFLMAVGEGNPYFDTSGSGIYDIRRTYKLKVENAARGKALSNCTIQLMSVTPATDYGDGPWPLVEDISLAAGQHIFIPLVTYGEAREPEKHPCADSIMTMGTESGRPCLDADKEYTLVVRATAPETAYSDFQCRVWVGTDGRLRIDDRADNEFWISLPDASRQFYEKFQETRIGAAAEWDSSPGGILNYCGVFITQTKALPLFGKRPPSTISKKIDPNEVRAMDIVDGAQVLQSRYHENSRYTDVMVRKADFEQMLQQVEENEPR